MSIINNTLNPPVNVVHVAHNLLTSCGQGVFFFKHKRLHVLPQELYQKLTDYDIRYYMYELLKVIYLFIYILLKDENIIVPHLYANMQDDIVLKS